jgi:hypothetical protein
LSLSFGGFGTLLPFSHCCNIIFQPLVILNARNKRFGATFSCVGVKLFCHTLKAKCKKNLQSIQVLQFNKKHQLLSNGHKAIVTFSHEVENA